MGLRELAHCALVRDLAPPRIPAHRVARGSAIEVPGHICFVHGGHVLRQGHFVPVCRDTTEMAQIVFDGVVLDVLPFRVRQGGAEGSLCFYHQVPGMLHSAGSATVGAAATATIKTPRNILMSPFRPFVSEDLFVALANSKSIGGN